MAMGNVSYEETLKILTELPSTQAETLRHLITEQSTNEASESMMLEVILSLLEELSLAQNVGISDEAAIAKLGHAVSELEHILERITSGASVGESDAVALVLQLVKGRLSYLRKKQQEKDKKKNKDHNLSTMPEKQRQIFAQHLRQLLFYEIYKFMNPNQIAGETRLDNFLHNLLRGGMQLAERYTSQEEIKHYEQILGASFLEHMQGQHELFTQSPTAYANRGGQASGRGM
jgi:hypothetical protein